MSAEKPTSKKLVPQRPALIELPSGGTATRYGDTVFLPDGRTVNRGRDGIIRVFSNITSAVLNETAEEMEDPSSDKIGKLMKSSIPTKRSSR